MGDGKAKIVKKLILQAAVETKTPLRISSGIDDGLTDILIMKNKQGQPIIPGTSIAGVIRMHIAELYNEAVAKAFFGSIDAGGNQSLLSVENILLSNAKMLYRDGVAIDAETGVAIKGAKFDYEMLERGAKGTVFMEVTVRNASLKEAPDGFVYKHSVNNDWVTDVIYSVADLLATGIKLGALTTKGFGKLEADSEVSVCTFDFSLADGADAWLKYITKHQLPKASYTGNANNKLIAPNDFIVQVECELHSSLLVRAIDWEQNEDKIVPVQMKSKGDYVIPGTSIKGVLRNSAKKILLSMSNYDMQKSTQFINKLMGFANDADGTGQKSRFTVEEAYIQLDKLEPIRQSRIRIDRFTGGVMNGALFTEEPVWQQDKGVSTITLNFAVKDCSKAEAGLLLLLIKELWLGNMAFGSDKSIGRGVLYGRLCNIDYDDVHYELRDDAVDLKLSNMQQEKLQSYVDDLVGDING